MKPVIRFFSILLFFIPLSVSAGYEITPACEKAMEQILNLMPVKARETLKAERLQHPDNRYTTFLENYADIIELLANGNKKAYESYLIRFGNRLNALEESRPVSPWYRIIRAEMLAQTGMINILYGDYLSGFSKIYSANHYVIKNSEIYPGFRMNDKLNGAFNIAFDNIPPVFKWVSRLMGMKGDARKGFQLLENYRVSVKGRHGLEPESLAYTVFAYKLVSEEGKVLLMMHKYYDPAYATVLSDYLYANLLYKNGINDDALKLLSKIREVKTEIPFIFTNYLYGKAKLNRLDEDADKYMLAFLKESGEINYKKEICNLLSWHYLIHGSQDKYMLYRNRIKDPGAEVTDRDREARVEVQRSYRPEVHLLKARLLVSGGYYESAEEALKPVTPTLLATMAYRTEYFLLEGKINASRQNTERAFENFNAAIHQGSRIPEHYASEAALEAGLLSIRLNKPEQAHNYLKAALSMHNSENVYLEIIRKRVKQAMEKKINP